nr:protein terminal ear1 homolog [Ipomoea batatas]
MALPPQSSIPTRTLLVSMVPSDVSESLVRRELEVFGDVRAVQMERVRDGIVTVHFYDLRHAQAAAAEIQDQHMQQQFRLRRHFESSAAGVSLPPPLPAPAPGLISGRAVWAQFIIPVTCSIPGGNNQGTLVLLNLDPAVSAAHLKDIFRAFGAVKELRETPMKRHQRFVEFYDVRDAANALVHMNRKEINGKPNRGRAATGKPWRKSLVGEGGNEKDPRFLINEEEIIKESDCRDSRTTVMIKNIPNKYSQKLLLNMLDNHCIHCNEQIAPADHHPTSSYDFVYLPIDFVNKCNVGYGFVNMTSPEAAWRLYKAFHLQTWEAFNSRKICEVTYARIQGIEALKEHFKNSRFPCQAEEYMPVVFSPPRDGRTLTVPQPIFGRGENPPPPPVGDDGDDGGAGINAGGGCGGGDGGDFEDGNDEDDGN